MLRHSLSRPRHAVLLACALAACVPAPKASAPEGTSYTEAEEPENTSYGRVIRFSSRIVVPPGRTREELTATLERAAEDLAEETGAVAVMVFAYREGDRPSGGHTAGRAIYAPDGRWEDADTGGPMAVRVDLNDLYFAPPLVHAAIRDTVVLADSYSGRVVLSREYGTWRDEDVVARPANGTRAVVLDFRSEPMGNREMIRYRVRTLAPVAEHEGWVHASDTSRH
jgi:hypothetical protein